MDMDAEGSTVQRLQYRPHIDGLRAVSVLAVVAYHAGVPGFPGGFIGVDVFFVISGFLITGLLVDEFKRDGNISLPAFYERRIRRLAPALFLVLAVTLVLGWIFLVPIGGEQQGVAKSALATMAFASNIYFGASTGGYFDAPSELQPLLHTWSLAVEEQFYVIWPTALALIAAWGRRRDRAPERVVAPVLAAVGLSSIALCVWASDIYPRFAFFGLPTRVWEFAAGGLALCAVRLHRTPAWADKVMLLAGLVAILFSVSAFVSGMPYPGARAALPVLGAALLIAGSESRPASWVVATLSWRPLVYVGLLSYSLYLWHWPLLAVARIHTLGELGGAGTAAICALAFVLAMSTYHWVENPVRRRSLAIIASRRHVWFGTLACLAVLSFASVGLGAGAKFSGLADTEHPSLSKSLSDLRKVRVACGQERPYSGTLKHDADCDRPEGANPEVLVWGDSHAAHLLPLVSGALARRHGVLRIRYMPECPPMQDYSPRLVGIDRSTGCEAFNRDVLTEATQLRSTGLRAVVLSARWQAYLSNPSAREAGARGLEVTVAMLTRLGLRVLLVAPDPELPHSVPACLARRPVGECGVSRAIAQQQRRDTMALLERVAGARPQVRLLDPFASLCTVSFCPAMTGWDVLYSDAHHLTEAGSRRLLPEMSPAFAWALASVPGSAALQGAPP